MNGTQTDTKDQTIADLRLLLKALGAWVDEREDLQASGVRPPTFKYWCKDKKLNVNFDLYIQNEKETTL